MFASAYLTLASIIQGVALAALVQRVESTYPTYDATCWVMVAATFVGIVVIWHEYLVMVMAYEWTPTLIDSVVPFGFVVGEVFAAHFVAHDVRNWLLAYGATFGVGFIAALVTWRQTASSPEKVRPAYRESRHRFRLMRALVVSGVALVAIVASLLYDSLGLWRIQLIDVSAMLVLMLVYVAASIQFWNGAASSVASPRS